MESRENEKPMPMPMPMQMELVSQVCLIHRLLLQLNQSHFDQPPNCTAILSQLLSTAETSVRLAKACALGPCSTGAPAAPPRSGSGSPRSDTSCQDAALKAWQEEKGQGQGQGKRREGEQACKKRKALPRRHSQVRMGSTGGVEGPLDDGHSWRKYGQKDILGAKHPRGYYRCTHRNSQGCLATKQLQRTDHDPTVFDVVYQGAHTCTTKSHSRSASASASINTPHDDDASVRWSHGDDYLNSLQATLTVQTHAIGSPSTAPQPQPCASLPAFSFPSTCHLASHTDAYLPPSFANSPATSGSNYFSVSPPPCTASGLGALGFRKVDSDFTEVISGLSAAASTTTSASPSPSPVAVGDVDFAFEGLDFEIVDIEPCSFDFS